MKLHKSLLYLVILLLIASFFLVACERPLPGGYNDPEAGTDTTVPEVPGDVPGVDSEGYPAEEEAAPEEAEAADAAEAYPAEEGAEDQTLMEEGEESAPEAEEAAPEGEEAAGAEAPAEEAAAEETAEIPGSHTVAEGENLYRIGLLYGISWLDLAEANGIVDPANLSVGQVLTIPSAESVAEEAPAEEAPVEEAVEGEETEAVEESAEEAQTAVAEETEEAAAAEEAESEVEATEETAEAAEAEEAPADEAAATEGPADEAAEVEESTADDGTRTYVVQAGDNLFRIGVNHGIDWTEIAALNGIVGAEIHPGMELIIPAAADAEAETESTGDTDADAGAEEAEAGEAEADGEETTYVVQEGDSIYGVAFEHGIPWTAIVEANDIEAPYTLEVGQVLVIIVPASEE